MQFRVFFHLIWALLLILPLAWLPLSVGNAGYFLMSLADFGFAVYRMGAAPCLSSYVLFHSWSGALMAIVPQQFNTLIAVIGLWILVLLRVLG
jgi:hypothetical protein